MSLPQKATLLLRFLKVIRSIYSLGRFVQLLRCATHISVNMSQKMSCQQESKRKRVHHAIKIQHVSYKTFGESCYEKSFKQSRE